MSDPFESDYKAMGLSTKLGVNAFMQVPPKGVLRDVCTAPKKRGPRTNLEKTLRVLDSHSPSFNVAIATRAESARTSAVRGRGVK